MYIYLTLTVFCIASFTILLGEGLSWLFVYRTSSYISLNATILKLTNKLEKSKEGVESYEKKKRKKIEVEEERLKQMNSQLNWSKMKSMFFIGIVFAFLLRTFGNKFSGHVVGKLSFSPFSFIQGLSHRGLEGDDMTECSFFFLYGLCTMFLKQNVQKILGFAPSRKIIPIN